MALNNNTPANTYIYIDNLVITFENQSYPINNIYTNKKYIYFDKNKTDTLYLSDIRKKDENLIYIIKNLNGNGIIINNEKVKLIFDNFDKEGIVRVVENVKNISETYKLEMGAMSKDVEELSDKYKKDRSFDEIKEVLNTAIINCNSSLIAMNSLITSCLLDGLFTEYEKGQVQLSLNEISNQSVETLACADALMDLYCEYNKIEDSNDGVYQNKVNMETLLSQLKVDLGKILEDSNDKYTIDNLSYITTQITTIIEGLEALRIECNNITFLGAGGTIPNEVYQANNRIDKLTDSFTELQASILGTMNSEKNDIESKFEFIRKLGNKTVEIVNNANHKGGVLTKEEYSSLNNHVSNLQNTFSSLKGYYESYYSNTNLSENSKDELEEAYSDFKDAHYIFTGLISKTMSDLNISKDDNTQYGKALTDYRNTRYTFRSKLYYCINEINNELSKTTLKQIKEEFSTQIAEIKQLISKIENDYSDLAKRVEELEKGE